MHGRPVHGRWLANDRLTGGEFAGGGSANGEGNASPTNRPTLAGPVPSEFPAGRQYGSSRWGKGAILEGRGQLPTYADKSFD